MSDLRQAALAALAELDEWSGTIDDDQTYEIADALRAALAEPEPEPEQVVQPHSVFSFLLGESALDGVWFGDRHPTERGAYWWREHLRSALAEPEQHIGPEWTPCVKLPVVVHVREQRPGETHISTREGITPAQPNDLIMRGVEGEEYPIGRELFHKTYRLAEPFPRCECGDRASCDCPGSWERGRSLGTPKEHVAPAALTPPVETKAEPVLYWHKPKTDDQEFIEPEAVNGHCPDCVPLYANPPTERRPMTDAEIDALHPSGIIDCLLDPWDMGVGDGDETRSIAVDIRCIARAVERHHGIGGSDE